MKSAEVSYRLAGPAGGRRTESFYADSGDPDADEADVQQQINAFVRRMPDALDLSLHADSRKAGYSLPE